MAFLWHIREESEFKINYDIIIIQDNNKLMSITFV